MVATVLVRPATGSTIKTMTTDNESEMVALVTGANKGIGYEIAAGLGALGWTVGVGARDDQRREDAVAKLRASGVDAFGVPLDVTDDASVAAAAALIEEGAGRLDVLGVRSPEQGATIAIRLATLPDDGPTGGYVEDTGTIPW